MLQGKNPVFLSSYEHPRESLFFQFPSFFYPGFPACNFGLQMKNLSACGRHQGIHPHARKKPSDTQGSFQVGEKAFSFKSNIFVAPLFDKLLSDTLFMDCFLLFLSSWSFDGKAVWHTMWYVGSWCYCIYIVSFTVLSQFNFYEMHMTSSVGSVSQILYVNRSVYFSWLCVYFSYFHVKGKLCVNEDNQINIIIPPANERLAFPSYHIFIYECFSIQFISQVKVLD